MLFCLKMESLNENFSSFRPPDLQDFETWQLLVLSDTSLVFGMFVGSQRGVLIDFHTRCLSCTLISFP